MVNSTHDFRIGGMVSGRYNTEFDYVGRWYRRRCRDVQRSSGETVLGLWSGCQECLCISGE